MIKEELFIITTKEYIELRKKALIVDKCIERGLLTVNIENTFKSAIDSMVEEVYTMETISIDFDEEEENK